MGDNSTSLAMLTCTRNNFPGLHKNTGKAAAECGGRNQIKQLRSNRTNLWIKAGTASHITAAAARGGRSPDLWELPQELYPISPGFVGLYGRKHQLFPVPSPQHGHTGGIGSGGIDPSGIYPRHSSRKFQSPSVVGGVFPKRNKKQNQSRAKLVKSD